MGNHFICMPKKDGNEVGSRNKRQSRSQRKIDEEFLHRQALAMAIHQQQISQRFEGSMSRRIGSTSSRRQNIPDSVLNVNKILENIDVIETKIFVLIHGEGFGAWCWYKSMALLEESGLIPIAIDLTGSGIDHTDPNSITTLEDYSKPLINYLEKLPENVKVILVGHSCGGASVSYALEQYPEKISKAIFVGATMMSSGQRPFDVFAEELGSAQIFMQQSPFLVYANGKDKAPTSLKLGKQQLMGLYFNQTTSKDIALATVSMRPIPLAPIMESLLLSSEKFGISRRFFIQTLEDHILSPDVQEKLVRENPPEGVYKIKGSDHCPFFSKPQSLHKIFLEIAQIP